MLKNKFLMLFLATLFSIIISNSAFAFDITVGASSKAHRMVTTTTATTATTTTTMATTTEATTEITTSYVEPTTQPPTNAAGVPLTGKELNIYNAINGADKLTIEPFTATINETINENTLATIKQIDAKLSNGDYYWIRRYDFKVMDKQDYISAITIPGNEITVRYVDQDTNEWVNTSNLNNLKIGTYFIDTDLQSMVISVPAVYKKDFTSNTLTMVKEKEKKIAIEKIEEGYKLTFRFPQDKELIGEIWALQSSSRLLEWNKASHFNELKTHDLYNERRWSWDGYYFKIPSNYVPTGANVLYRHPAVYTGGSWAKYVDYRLAKDMGYIMSKVCIKNQNSTGFWATGPKSLWLEADFNIKENFYDTRFNTDFATCLIYAYKNYNDAEILEAAVKYAEFFFEHAEKNHYTTDSDGWLVEDYGGGDDSKRTHVSLNHQLAEINFLYELYNLTKQERYRELGDKMLLAIEDTRDHWILPDNNLSYAIMYEGTANVMVDYPYLTYNDLFETKNLLNVYFNQTNPTIDALLAAKKDWMDKNKITGYRK